MDNIVPFFLGLIAMALFLLNLSVLKLVKLWQSNDEWDEEDFREPREEFKPTHRHYKGGLYEFLCVAEHADNLGLLVIYRDSEGSTWARDRSEFYGKLEDGRERFERIKE